MLEDVFFLKKRTTRYLLLSIIIGGLFLRVWNLWNISLWFDESLPFVETEEEVKKILFSGKFYCPIIYNTFIHYFWKIVGHNEILLRLSSVIFGIVSIALIYYVGELLFDRKVGILGAFILAISPFHIYYSQELRMYSLISLLSLASVYFLIKAMQNNRIIYWLVYTISNIVNIYTHPVSIFILFAQVLFFLFYIKKYKYLLNRWIVVHFLILILAIPWIISILSGFILFINKDDWFFKLSFSWIPKITWLNIFYTFKNFAIGYNATKPIYLFATVLFSILFFLGVFKMNKKQKELVLSLLCLFVPIVSAYFISKFRPCYLDRYFIASSLFFYLFVGNGLARISKKYAISIVICIITVSFLALKNYYKNYLPGRFEEHIGVQAKKEYRELAKYLAENINEKDIILHTCRSSIPSFEYYFGKIYKGNSPIKKNLILQFIKDDNNEPKIFEYDVVHHRFTDQSQNIDLGKQNKVWILFSGWDFVLTSKPDSLESKVIQWIDKYYIRKTTKTFSGIIAYLYSKDKIGFVSSRFRIRPEILHQIISLPRFVSRNYVHSGNR